MATYMLALLVLGLLYLSVDKSHTNTNQLKWATHVLMYVYCLVALLLGHMCDPDSINRSARLSPKNFGRSMKSFGLIIALIIAKTLCGMPMLQLFQLWILYSLSAIDISHTCKTKLR